MLLGSRRTSRNLQKSKYFVTQWYGTHKCPKYRNDCPQLYPLRGHLARENSTRGHFEVSSKPLGSGKRDSRPLRGHLARLGSAWLDSASLNIARLGSAGSACLDPGGLTQLGLGRNWSKRLFKETIRENCPGTTEL